MSSRSAWPATYSSMARSIFITATDTGAGKTHVTSHLVRQLLARGIRAKAIKPVASGLDAEGRNDDIAALLTAQGLTDADAVNLYRFPVPASPHIAAEAAGNRIDPARLVDWCRAQAADRDVCLIEGIGGLMVPLTNDFLVCDWIAAMPEAEVWLVAGARLGAINHTLLTLSKLQAMGRPAARIILNDAGDNPEALQHLHRTISALAIPDTLLTLPYGKIGRLHDLVTHIA